jgi:hypothetical protein
MTATFPEDFYPTADFPHLLLVKEVGKNQKK